MNMRTWEEEEVLLEFLLKHRRVIKTVFMPMTLVYKLANKFKQ